MLFRSRAIGIAGERVLRLNRFDLPNPDTARTDELLDNPAVALYADRASAVDPAFRMTRANADDVAELARRLDGLPLAIELAAARAHILTPRAQLAALDEHSALALRSRRAVAIGAAEQRRHVDLRSAVGTSYLAASEPARLVLRRMSVAADAVTSERVRDLVTEPGWTLADVLDALGELVDLGLADVDRGTGGDPRFRLHPTVAAYGREQLDAEEVALDVQRRYARAVMAMAATTRRTPHRRRLEVLAEASAELHAAFAWLSDAGDVEAALELAADLGPLWAQRGLFQGPGSRFEALLRAAESGEATVTPATLAHAQLWWTRLVIHDASASAHRDALIARLHAAIAAAREADDAALLLFGLHCMVWSVFVTGDMPATSAAVAEGLVLAERIGDRGRARGFAYSAAMLANMAGDVETALRYAIPALEDSLRDHDLIDTIRVCSMLWAVPPGTPGLPAAIPTPEALLQACLDAGELVEASLLYAALVVHTRGDGGPSGRAEAARWAMRGLDLAQQLGAWYAGGMTTAALVLLAHELGHDEAVATLHGCLLPVLSEVSVGMGPYAPRYAAAIAESRNRLGESTFDRNAANAAILDRDVAIERAAAYAQSVVAAHSGPTIQAVPSNEGTAGDRPARSARQAKRALVALARQSQPIPGTPERLTPRELDVLRALMTGATNGEIARSLGLRPKTIMHHSVSIYAKLGVRGRTEATAWAYRNGLEPHLAIDEPQVAAPAFRLVAS